MNINDEQYRIKHAIHSLESVINDIQSCQKRVISIIHELDIAIASDLNIKEINNVADEYINQIQYIQNRLGNYYELFYTGSVYAPPDIMNKDKTIEWE